MFIGHFALGFAAKPAVPRVSLAVLILAALFADVLWPILVLAGVEQVRIDPGNTAFTPLEFVSYPWSHSLLLLAVWGVCLGAAYRIIFGGRRTVVVLALLVISHWVLDWITHAPDMPLYPGGPKEGLSLWNSIPLTMVVETLMFAAGLYVYTRTTRAKDAIGRWGFVSLGVTLAAIYFVDGLFGAPPPTILALCVVGVAASVVFTAWAWWTDRHREARAGN
jgi:hypothetical protein